MRSDLADWAGYGYCASHSRFFWDLRLHLVCIVHGLPVAWAVTSPSQDEREVLRSILEHLAPTSAHTIIADKGYRSKDLEDDLNQAGLTLLRPAARNETPRPGSGLLRPLRQRIESVFHTFKDQLGLERHNGHTLTAVTARVHGSGRGHRRESSRSDLAALPRPLRRLPDDGDPRVRLAGPQDHAPLAFTTSPTQQPSRPSSTVFWTTPVTRCPRPLTTSTPREPTCRPTRRLSLRGMAADLVQQPPRTPQQGDPPPHRLSGHLPQTGTPSSAWSAPS